MMELPTHIVAVGALILNDSDEILLINNPRKGWEYPGGMVEIGETLPQALIREVNEETGVQVEVINLVGIYSNTEQKQGYNGVKIVPTIVTIDFICRYIGGELKTSDESLDVRWFSKEEALNIIKVKQLLRLKNALNFEMGIPCVGWHLNELKELSIHESYLFIR